MHFRRLAVAVATALPSPLVVAVTDAPTAAVTELERIVVSATLYGQAVRDIATTTSAVLREEMDRRLVQDLRDALRYEAGVSVIGGGRFGIGSVAVRGLDGNRVRLEIDGVRLPDAFAIGSFSSAGKDFVDPDTLKRIEVVRGSASALHGSDALGGIVSFVTKDPGDYVAGATDGTHSHVKASYDSADRQTVESATVAHRSGRHGWLATVSHRQGHELDNRGETDTAGTSRTRANPQDTDGASVLGKYVYEGNRHRDRITFEGVQHTARTALLNQLGERSVGPSRVDITRLDGDDRKQRARLSWQQEWHWDATWIDRLDAQVYSQISRTRQDTFEDRTTVAGQDRVRPVHRFRRFDFEQRELGLTLTAFTQIQSASVTHALAWGVDLGQERIREQRDGFQLDRTSGVVSPVVMPDIFPVRDFPLSDVRRRAAFVQDDIAFGDGRVHLTPALRYDHYAISPRADAVFAQDNPGITPVGLDAGRASPKLGALVSLSPAWKIFGQYAEGFRAPPYNDINIGFTNLAMGYIALPNRALKPESSRGMEVGIRGDFTYGYADLATYRNRYRDFIESLRYVGNDPATGLMQFQSQNRGRVDIHGTELRAGLSLDAFTPALRNWELRSALAWSRGKDRLTREPLLSIEPAKAVIGLVYGGDRWEWETSATLAAAKRRVAPTAASPTPFRTPGWSTIDSYVRYTPVERLSLHAGITNLADRRYWSWNDVRGLPAHATIDRLSAPGRAFAVGAMLTLD
ncbi:TonB-dependent hemoglobin/transferrin/lactoferrin family receptor [Tahibacter amnicola]|uniref:TonB-dependent hemoglobin/transferrin/lactoferrin family receptor n=1 Tax=Tahibacter amnicola TaxID=2976241 RepID=A0ABY6BI84_9GAMM|nr:TonB-dependent hemoglobin/transferrin/lactoferrin family receptor [Tahibacter amnicola]UXI67572.1 TonB-dependent hemoglobin/transferrin/lactoferrin family receptor [Tahibacter amnicola]